LIKYTIAMAIFNENYAARGATFRRKTDEASLGSLFFRWADEAFSLQKESHREENQKGGRTGGVLYLQAIRIWKHDLL
jgi:hypothetical protein